MNLQTQPSRPHARWQWPLNIASYDRSPTLSEEESAELEYLVQSHHQAHKRTRTVLHRLLQPIDDVLAYTNAPWNKRPEIVRVLLVEMQRRHTAFWGWTMEQWQESIGPNQRAFARRYRLPGRHYLPLLAYLLEVLPDASPLFELIQIPSAAQKIFGKEVIVETVERLTEVFRQAATSHIITNAHRINAGQYPHLTPTTKFAESDCLWLEAAEPELGAEGIRHLVSEFLPKHGINPAQQVQVLCPATRGEIGTRQLNVMLQQTLNPAKSGKTELARSGSVLRVGDRVIQQVNDYQREVFNGDVGTVTSIDLEEQEVVVQFADERAVSYDYADLSELSLAWAVTIHKSQGSEYPVVILPLYMQHYLLLSRNLLYTGLTRAKQLAILVGPPKAIGFAVKRTLDRQRYTALADRLKQTERVFPL